MSLWVLKARTSLLQETAVLVHQGDNLLSPRVVCRWQELMLVPRVALSLTHGVTCLFFPACAQQDGERVILWDHPVSLTDQTDHSERHSWSCPSWGQCP